MSEIKLNKEDTEKILFHVFDLFKDLENIKDFKFDSKANYRGALRQRVIEYKKKYQCSDYIEITDDVENSTIYIVTKNSIMTYKKVFLDSFRGASKVLNQIFEYKDLLVKISNQKKKEQAFKELFGD